MRPQVPSPAWQKNQTKTNLKTNCGGLDKVQGRVIKVILSVACLMGAFIWEDESRKAVCD
jgi:hypothetical protein